MLRSRSVPALLVVVLAWHAPAGAQSRPREAWIGLAREGFVVPAGDTAIGLLVEMNDLLASPDPVLRDEVAYSAAATWIVSAPVVEPADLRRLIALWTANLDDGLGTGGDQRVLRRSFSALCLSLIAARDAATPFLTADEVERLYARLLDYFAREQDTRGFDRDLGWIHALAHTADAFKFLARGRHWTVGHSARLLEAMAARLDAQENVFVWGEQGRFAAAIFAAVRRPDSDAAAVVAWLTRWEDAHAALWARGPHVEPPRFARVENAVQTMRALLALAAMDTAPTPSGEAARRAAVATLARMR